MPAGIKIDRALIRREMARRAPGQKLTTSRTEADEVDIVSGIYQERTTGGAICGIIRNTNVRSKDYQTHILRPGHADLTAFLKYKGFADMRGGGQFSGRLTAPLVFAGAVCRHLLEGITIHATLSDVAGKTQPSAIAKAIREAQAQGDSVGGIVECVADGVPCGLGEPLFQSMESRLASLLFSVPGVKGVEFGEGFGMARMRGSEANDELRMKNEELRIFRRPTRPQSTSIDLNRRRLRSEMSTEVESLSKGRIVCATNHNGGINGGITNGMPLTFRVAFKPTPSIAVEQDTVDVATMTNVKLKLKGRHDPCIAVRAVPVVEACVALCLAELGVRS